MVQKVDLVTIALRVSGAGAGAARLGPVDLGAALRVQVKGAQARFSGQLQHDPAGDALAGTEDRRRGQLRAVQQDGEEFEPIEDHGSEGEEGPKAGKGSLG